MALRSAEASSPTSSAPTSPGAGTSRTWFSRQPRSEMVAGSPLTPHPPSAASAHRLDALDELGVFAAVFVPDRLHRVLEGLLVRDRVDLDAGGLHLLERVLLFLLPELAFIELRIGAYLRDHVLVGLLERVPGGP